MTITCVIPEIQHQHVDVEVDVPAKMRDGVVLYADIYRPRNAVSCPVLLMRTPYDKSRLQDLVYRSPAWYARFGYIVVVQDCRGRYLSEGDFYPYRNEELDTFDTIAWVSKLPGSSGDVAMYGMSYPGALQLLAAASQPPALKTIMPSMTCSDYFNGWTYENGAFCQAFIQSWVTYLAQDKMIKANDTTSWKKITDLQWELPKLYAQYPLSETFSQYRQYMPYYWDWLEHDRYDDYWKQISVKERYEEIKIPALHITGWYDSFSAGTIENFMALYDRYKQDVSRGKQRLIVGPWYHLPWQQQVGGVDFGEDGQNFVNNVQLNWLEQNLRGGATKSGGKGRDGGSATESRGNGRDGGSKSDAGGNVDRATLEDSPVSVFVLFKNKWQTLEDWPPKNVGNKTYYLHSAGGANSLSGDGHLSEQTPGEEPWDTYNFHALDPVPSRGGHSCCFDFIAPMGAQDQRLNEYRNDVLVYTTEVMDNDLVLMGKVTATIYAASTACDTDFTATLVDVAPCGQALNIVNGIMRASYRNSLSHPEPIVPGEVYEYKITLGWIAALIKTGHRLRFDVSSSNFPHFDRNSNDGKKLGQSGLFTAKVARQTLFHDARYPSSVSLPVLSS